MEGYLLIDKPAGWTSFDVVNYVRSIVARVEGKKPRNVKVGHIGTLDPAATGLLVLCVGKYTKKVPELIKHDKEYEAEITFGATSTTGDGEGEITQSPALSHELQASDIEKALQSFVGEIEQVPPAFSAIKVNGKRAYELARAGKEVQLQPRKVTIYDVVLTSFAWPKATITCTVSSGTYIRVLVEDIGAALGVGAYMSALRRTKIADWSVTGACDPKEVSIENIREKLLA